MAMAAVFRQPKLLRAFDQLGGGRVRPLVERFCAGQPGAARAVQPFWSRAAAGAGSHRQCGGAPHARGPALFRAFLLQVSSAPRSQGRALRLEPAAGEFVDRTAHAPGQRGVGSGVGAACPASRRSGKTFARGARTRACRSSTEPSGPCVGPGTRTTKRKTTAARKKSHRRKSLFVSAQRQVVYLGPASPGSVHDKKLADEGGLSFPSDALALKDPGFQGYEPPGAATLQPKKEKRKPGGRALHPIGENHQPNHQPGAGRGRTCRRRSQKAPQRGRDLPQLAAGHGRSGHPRTQRSAQLARRLSKLKSQRSAPPRSFCL